MRVKLFFEISKDLKLEQIIKDFEFLRLKSFIQFKTQKGWSKIYDSIVDTGAPISLIPLFIWKRILYTKLTDYCIYGITRKPECLIPVIIGKVDCILLDEEENQTSKLNIYAYLALTSEVPLILGFKDLLSKFFTCFDYKNKEAWIEER
jgi:hypothetical protein